MSFERVALLIAAVAISAILFALGALVINPEAVTYLSGDHDSGTAIKADAQAAP